MNIVKVFIASSSEMRTERLELIDLLVDLNDEYEKADIKFEPVVWEFMDSSMRESRKEDDYLREMVKCQIVIVMFWRTLGEYTLEEFEVAIKEMQANKEIKAVYVLIKEPYDWITNDLSEFKNLCKTFHHSITYRFENHNKLRCIVENLITNGSYPALNDEYLHY